jgi:hypothetical protein
METIAKIFFLGREKYQDKPSGKAAREWEYSRPEYGAGIL